MDSNAVTDTDTVFDCKGSKYLRYHNFLGYVNIYYVLSLTSWAGELHHAFA